MKVHSTLVALVLTAFILSPAVTAGEADDRPAMQCDIGPLTKNFGGTEWVVYSCSDKKTVVIYSAANNPGKEFYFMFFPDGDDLRLYGEGNGDKTYTDAAFRELEPMTAQDVAALVKETELASRAAPARE
jgi:hypothetical protein